MNTFYLNSVRRLQVQTSRLPMVTCLVQASRPGGQPLARGQETVGVLWSHLPVGLKDNEQLIKRERRESKKGSMDYDALR